VTANSVRILQLIDHLGLGGAQVALADLLSAWQGDDEFDVLGLGCSRQLLSRFHDLSQSTVTTLDHAAWNPATMTAVRRRVARGSYDLVHAHLRKASAAALFAAAGSKVPVVLHVHGDPRHDTLLRWTLRASRRTTALALAVSQATAAAVTETVGIPVERLRVVGNPVDVDRLHANSAGFEQCRARLAIDSQTFLLGYVGRVAQEKGLSDLLQGVARFRRANERVALVVVGDGPLSQTLQDEATQLGIGDAAHFVGHQERSAAWIKACDALVLPSLTEGLPLTILEAFALGTPVVATRVGGIPELVLDGETGLLIAPHDVDGLCRAVERLQRSAKLARALAAAAERRVLADFAAARVALRVRAAYDDAMAQSGPA